MERIYLYVPPEEYAEVKASGACWDDYSKRWFVPPDSVSAALSRWMGEGEGGEFGVESNQAFVAAAHVACTNCGEEIEVICIYCQSARDLETGEALEGVTLSNISSMDDALAATLERRRFFRTLASTGADEGYFANHCPHCGAVQEDYLLHSEPGDVFFCIPEAEPGSVEFTAVEGRIRANGDCGFGV
jgi:predicted RNA-binding Zn-ribbon protein involved in translation (DUF1610 family)